MSGIPLIETNDPALIARGYNLGLKVVPNLLHVLTAEKLEYYETHLPELKDALARGLIFSQPERASAEAQPMAPIVPTPTLFKTIETDIEGLTKTQEFAEKYFGIKINLRERFAIPAELPWKSVIPVFDPGKLTNRDAIQKALKASGLAVWEEVDVMKYSGSQANKEPTLHIIQNSIRPDEDTMGFSPDQLKATGKNWLDLRGYVLAFGVYHFTTGQYLDPQTWTWFPNNRLSSVRVADGRWYPVRRGVGFGWYCPGYGSGRMGSRLAIPVPLLP